MASEIEKSLFEDIQASLKRDVIATITLLSFFVVFTLFVRFFLKIPIPLNVIFILLVWVLVYTSHYFIISKQKNFRGLYKFQFVESVFDLFFVTAIVHFLGGAEWIGPIIYLVVLIWAMSILPVKQNLILTFFYLLFYTALLIFEYFQILPHYSVFGFSSGAFRSPQFLIVQITVTAALYFFIILSYGDTAEKLRKKQLETLKAQEELKEAKNVLEIKVRARTRELQELANNLEEQVKTRTKELQEKIEELETFQRLTVGRELKMAELKEEIKRLKEKLKNQKNT